MGLQPTGELRSQVRGVETWTLPPTIQTGVILEDEQLTGILGGILQVVPGCRRIPSASPGHRMPNRRLQKPFSKDVALQKLLPGASMGHYEAHGSWQNGSVAWRWPRMLPCAPSGTTRSVVPTTEDKEGHGADEFRSAVPNLSNLSHS